MAPHIAYTVVLLAWLPNIAAAHWVGHGQQPLSSPQQVRTLAPGQAEEARPVRLTGVVTHLNSRGGDFWIQDESAGIYVQPSNLARELATGDRVEVIGITEKGAFAPCVVPHQVTRLGPGRLPEPFPYTLAIEESRWLDGQYVKAWGVVLNARSMDETTRIDVSGPYGHAVLVLDGAQWAMPARELRNRVVVFSGVCAASFTDRQVSHPPLIYVDALPKPEPIPTGEDGLEQRSRIESLLDLSPHPIGRRAKIVGVVTAAPLPNLLVVQDDSGGACVWTEKESGIALGTQVEATGLTRVEGRRVSLTLAQVKAVGAGTYPSPAPATATELAAGARDALVVQLDGRLEEIRVREEWTAATLNQDGVRFEAFVPGLPHQNGLGEIKIGSRISVVGVPAEITPDRQPVHLPGLFARSSEAISLLEAPAPLPAHPAQSWWTAERAGFVVGGFAAILLLGCGWLFALRVQVRRASGEVRQHYEEKARLALQLKEASKLEAVGRLAGGIAHDFNNLLTVINGCAELLAEETAREGGRLAELTDDIRKAGERAASLTGQLLTFSRKRETLISAVDLNEVVIDTVRLLDRVISETIRIETSLESELPAIRGEPGLLHQVIMNLAVNAKDAMPNGGVLSLSTSLVAEPEAPSNGWPGPARHLVRLTVADSGVGMSAEVKARLFEPFFTTKEIGSGTGLGLATVYGIIQTVGGNVQVDSSVGGGTRFLIDFRVHGEPVSDAELSLGTPTPLPPSRAVNAAMLLGKTVLVVEDNEMVRQTLLHGLASEGATVLSADRPDTALQMLASHSGPIDVLVTDVVMPGMSGPALAECAREARPGMQVVFISGYTADEVLRQGVLEEQVEFLQKPFTPDQLVRRLRRILARSSAPV